MDENEMPVNNTQYGKFKPNRKKRKNKINNEKSKMLNALYRKWNVVVIAHFPSFSIFCIYMYKMYDVHCTTVAGSNAYVYSTYDMDRSVLKTPPQSMKSLYSALVLWCIAHFTIHRYFVRLYLVHTNQKESLQLKRLA